LNQRPLGYELEGAMTALSPDPSLRSGHALIISHQGKGDAVSNDKEAALRFRAGGLSRWAVFCAAQTLFLLP